MQGRAVHGAASEEQSSREMRARLDAGGPAVLARGWGFRGGVFTDATGAASTPEEACAASEAASEAEQQALCMAFLPFLPTSRWAV